MSTEDIFCTFSGVCDDDDYYVETFKKKVKIR